MCIHGEWFEVWVSAQFGPAGLVAELSVARSDVLAGFDLDGDGEGDNGLSSTLEALDALVEEAW